MQPFCFFVFLCTKKTVVREPFLPGSGIESTARLRAKYKVGVLELCGDDVRNLLQPEVRVLREGTSGSMHVGG